MIERFLRYVAYKSHNVNVQLLLASLYGLVKLYGWQGAFAIVMKARKQHARNTQVER